MVSSTSIKKQYCSKKVLAASEGNLFLIDFFCHYLKSNKATKTFWDENYKCNTSLCKLMKVYVKNWTLSS